MTMIRLSALCVLLMLMSLHATGTPTPTGTPNSTTSLCQVFTNGCSIPGGLPFIYKTKFTPACKKHDVCYSCGQQHGWSRAQCDTAFKHDMYKLCVTTTRKRGFFKTLWGLIKSVAGLMTTDKLKRCKAGADIYYHSVDGFGQANFEKVSPQWCMNNCTKSLGDPNKV